MFVILKWGWDNFAKKYLHRDKNLSKFSKKSEKLLFFFKIIKTEKSQKRFLSSSMDWIIYFRIITWFTETPICYEELPIHFVIQNLLVNLSRNSYKQSIVSQKLKF